jgi:hypothetical protein
MSSFDFLLEVFFVVVDLLLVDFDLEEDDFFDVHIIELVDCIKIVTILPIKPKVDPAELEQLSKSGSKEMSS